MLLWNTTQHEIESKFDGKISLFKPKEKKRFYDLVEGSHILLKLEPYGVVEIPDRDDLTEKILEPYLVKGLQSRLNTHNKVIQNFRTMNKEREAAKLSADMPSDDIVDKVKECNSIKDQLKALKADELSMVDKYLSETESEDAQRNIDDTFVRIEKDGVLGHKLTGIPNHVDEREPVLSGSTLRANSPQKPQRGRPRKK